MESCQRLALQPKNYRRTMIPFSKNISIAGSKSAMGTLSTVQEEQPHGEVSLPVRKLR